MQRNRYKTGDPVQALRVRHVNGESQEIWIDATVIFDNGRSIGVAFADGVRHEFSPRYVRKVIR